MTGNKAGNRKAAKTTKKRYGRNFFRECGRRGGNPALLKGKGQ